MLQYNLWKYSWIQLLLQVLKTSRSIDSLRFACCGTHLWPTHLGVSPRSSLLALAECESSSLRPVFLVLEDWVSSVASLENTSLDFCSCFASVSLPRDETRPCSNSEFPVCWIAHILRTMHPRTQEVSWHQINWPRLAIAEPLWKYFHELSLTRHSAFCSRGRNGCRKTSRNSWSSTNEGDGPMHHVWKLPLVNMSTSWFLVSTYFIWIMRSKLFLSNNQSSATLWTCALNDHFDHYVTVFKYAQDSPWEEFAFVVT